MTARVSPLLAAVLVLAACGANSTVDVDLTARGEDGRSIMRASGCAACHGSDGGGGIGPSFHGLFGSTVELDGGGTVTADRDYLYDSITDPRALIVEGHGRQMPENDLDDAEVEAVIDYIVELADVGDDG